MTPLRIAYLVGALRPGGAERQMLSLAERLPRDRFSIDFLVLSGSAEYDERAVKAGAGVRLLGSQPGPGESWLKAMTRRSRKVTRYLGAARRQRYDIIDAWLYPADVTAILLRPLTRTSVVISGRRNLDPHETFGPLDGTLDRIVSRMSDAVVANSAAAGAYAIRSQHIDPAKVRVIRNGVERSESLSADQRTQARRRLGVGDDDIVIGCVGNLQPVKRQALLVDAVAQLVSDHPRLRLVLVGDGPMRPELERQIQQLGLDGTVTLHGTVLDPAPLYGAFDIVAQASRSEGLPNVSARGGRRRTPDRRDRTPEVRMRSCATASPGCSSRSMIPTGWRGL